MNAVSPVQLADDASAASGPYQVVPPLSDEEFAALKANIAQHGVLVAVEYDEEGNILDGHHRVRACRELGITRWPRITRKDLGDDREKRAHARRLNLVRRHLTGEAKRRLIAEQLRDTPAQTNRAVGREIGVDHHTVEAVRSELERNGEIPQYERAMAEAEVSRPGPARRSYSYVDADDTKSIVTRYTGETEWHTPAVFVESARDVLGTIDLDPASNDVAQETIRAETYFTKEMDGLAQPWAGRVWLNPPYAAGVVDKFVDKLVEHVRAGDVTEAILLVNNQTDARWFHRALGCCARFCFTQGRIRFDRADGDEAGAPTNGNVFFYFGDRPKAFERIFSLWGFVAQRGSELHGSLERVEAYAAWLAANSTPDQKPQIMALMDKGDFDGIDAVLGVRFQAPCH